MKVRFPLLSLALGLVASASAHAQVLWTGLINGSTSNPLNWIGTPAGADLLFTASIRPSVIVDASLAVRSLTFNLLYPSYSFSTANGSSLGIGSGGIFVTAQDSNTVAFATNLPLTLTASQTWAVDGSLIVAGSISDPPADTVVLTKTGAGRLVLNGVNTFKGGLVVQAGSVTVGSNTVSTAGVITSGPTGTGTLTLGTNTTFGANRAGLTLGNPLSLGNGVTLLSGSSVSSEAGLNLSGEVNTASDDMIVGLSGSRPIVFSGALDGPAHSTIRFRGVNAGGADGAKFTGTTSANIAGLIADNASLYFVSAASLPGTVTVGAVNSGYTAVMATTVSAALPASTLLSRIATPAAFAGTFGFDTESGSSHVYTENLNFSAFTQATFSLGSSSSAVLSGTLTPPISGGTANFRFGSGGGRLSVRSTLTNTVDPITTQAVPTAVVLTTNRTSDVGRGQVELTGANTYTGGTTLQNGALIVGNGTTRTAGQIVSGPIGTAALNVGTSTQPLILASNVASGATLYNNVVLSGPLQLGLVDTMTNPATTSLDSNLLVLSGNISGVGRLDVYGRAIFDGTNTYSGGTYAHSGGLIFATASSLPSTGALRSEAHAYIGIASIPSGSFQTSYINRFDPVNTLGTIGFDTLDATTTVFTNAISLAAFTSPTVRLGSATSARITGAITPAGTTYRFGGGAGALEVDNDLNRGTELELSSPAGAPLMMRVSGKISYSGATTVANSGLVLADNALASSSAFTMDATSYIGTEDPTFDNSFATYLDHFAAGLDRGIIGFDTDPVLSTRTISTALDLARFTAVAPNFYLGTSSSIIFGAGSSILLAPNATAYRLTGYRGGRLQIDTVLSGANSVIIGDPASVLTHVSPAGVTSAVVLNAANTFTNGTTLYAGNLYLGTSTVTGAGIVSGPVGLGTLTVAPNSFGLRAGLRVLSAPVTLANAIALNADLEVGNDFTLTGNISGSGRLQKVDAGTLTLSGNNPTWSGGITVTQGTATFTADDAAGTGSLVLGSTFASIANFTSAAPSIRALSGQNTGDQVALATNSALLITQSGSSQFRGTISGSGASVTLQGDNGSSAHQLTLSGTNSYTGGTTIGPNVTLLAASNGALGSTGTVTVAQGTLAVASGVAATFNGGTHPLVLDSGTVRGTGTIVSDTSLSVKSGVNGAIVLSPGFTTPGQLKFNFTSGATLILGSGGQYTWRLSDATNVSGGWDTVAVTGGVDVTATSLAPFAFTISTVSASGSSGAASNFDVYSSYSWTLVSATSLTGFDATKFTVDTSAFANPTLDGTFSLGLNNAGTSLMLNYTAAAIPEPSTWALMITGAAALTIQGLRRRRRISKD